MAEIRDELVLDVSRALREVDELERALNRALASTELTIDNSALARTESLAEATGDAFEDSAEAADRVARETDAWERALRDVGNLLELSEDDARRLARAMIESARAADDMDDDVDRVARSLDDAEDSARRLARRADDAADQTGRAGRAASELGGAWGRIAALGATVVAAFGIRELVDQLGKAVSSAAELGESVNAVNVVFGEGSREILSASEDAAERFGVSSRQLNQAATRVGAALLNAGFNATEAANQFLVLQERASDTASVLDTDVNDVLVALQAALRGEFDPIERFTGGMNQAAVTARALEQGLIGVGEELTNQARAQAVISLFLERTVRFQGDFANTADSAANRQRRLTAAVEDFRAEMGENLLPAFESLLDAAPAVLDLLRGFVPVLQDMASAVEEADFGEMVLDIRKVGSALSAMGQRLEGDVIGAETAEGVAAFINSVQVGIEPARAFEAVLTRIADEDLDFDTDDVADLVGQLQNTADLDIDQLRAILENVRAYGPAAGVSAREMVGLERALGGLISGLAEVPRDPFGGIEVGIETYERSLVTATTATFSQADAMDFLRTATEGVALDDLLADTENLTPELLAAAEAAGDFGLAVLRMEEELEDLEFEQLSGALDAAAAALEDKEGEILEDFSHFLDHLAAEIDKRDAFESNLAILRALGLDDLAAVFDKAGLPAAKALADAVSNPAEAQRAEALLEGQASSQAEAYVDSFTASLDGQPITDTLIANITDAATSADTPAVRQAFADLAAALAVEVPVTVGEFVLPQRVGQPPVRQNPNAPGAPVGNPNVTVNITSTGDTATDAARAVQAASRVYR